MAAAAGIVAAQRKHRTYFKRLPIRNVGGPRVVSSEQRRGACADAALEREAAREREVRMQRALDGLTHVPYIGVLVSETPSVSPANWAMKRGLVATAVQLSQRRLTFAFVLLPSSATPSVLELLPRDLFELVGHVLQCLPAGLAEVRFTEADKGCTICDNGVVLETPCLTEHERAMSPTRAPPRDIITVDRCGCQDSPPHAELVRTAVCAVNCIATDGMSSVSLEVERNEHAGKIMLGFVSAPCGGAFAPVFCGRPPHSGAAAGDRIEMRVNADERFVELKLNEALLGRVACSMPFYGDGFGSLCFAVGSDSDGCRVRIESADPALFDPQGDALAAAAADYARDHPVRFCEASSYYNTTAEGGRLATTLRVVDHGRLAPCDVIICDAIPGKHSVLFEVVHQPMGYGLHIGVARAEADVWRDALGDGDFWGLACNSGRLVNARYASRWPGQEGYHKGDQIELHIDTDAGTLHVKKNGRVLGAAVASRGALPVWEPLRWAIVGGEGDAIRVQCTDPMQFFN